VGAGEFDAVRGHCSSPCLRCNDGHLAAGQGPVTPKAKRSGEGQAPVYLLRAEWPAGTGEKDRRQPLWTGRQLRPACHATQTPGEVRWPRRKEGEQPNERNACGGDISVLSHRAASRPVRALLTLPHVPRRLVSVATRSVLSGRAAGRSSKPRHRSAPPGFRTVPPRHPVTCDPRSTTITGLMPAAVKAIRRS
ncbi:hypothetical protein SAMN05421762_3906, partial [Pseudooceanicola nitratireducens]